MTGVQTCALPILSRADLSHWFSGDFDDEDAEMHEVDEEKGGKEKRDDDDDEEEEEEELITRAAEEADRLHRELLAGGSLGVGDSSSVRVMDEKSIQEDIEKASDTTNQVVSLCHR